MVGLLIVLSLLRKVTGEQRSSTVQGDTIYQSARRSGAL